MKFLRGRRRRCSLYSVGPSCGSGSRRDTPASARRIGEDESLSVLCRETCRGSPEVSRGVEVPGVLHGEETRGGLGSYVNIDAMATDVSNVFLLFCPVMCSYDKKPPPS
jgi:hypothetical protein